MHIETTRFGSLEVADEDILKFPEGMLGFSRIHQYVIVEKQDDSLFLWLQALRKPSVAFPLLEPQIFEKNYRIELADEDRECLKVDAKEPLKLFAIITIPTDPTKMTANLKAPLVINIRKKLAKQVILHTLDYPIRKAIFSELQSYSVLKHRNIFPKEGPEAVPYQAIPIGEELESRI